MSLRLVPPAKAPQVAVAPVKGTPATFDECLAYVAACGWLVKMDNSMGVVAGYRAGWSCEIKLGFALGLSDRDGLPDRWDLLAQGQGETPFRAFKAAYFDQQRRLKKWEAKHGSLARHIADIEQRRKRVPKPKLSVVGKEAPKKKRRSAAMRQVLEP